MRSAAPLPARLAARHDQAITGHLTTATRPATTKTEVRDKLRAARAGTRSWDPDFLDLNRAVLAQRQCAGFGHPASSVARGLHDGRT
jgi:hypothetical protein